MWTPTPSKKPYTIIGKGFIDPSIHGLSSLERMQENVVDKAKEKGADAVLFNEIYLLNDGTSISSTSRTDSTGRVTVKHATIGPVISTRKEILFLKYDSN